MTKRQQKKLLRCPISTLPSSYWQKTKRKKCLTVPSPWKNSDKRQQEKNCLIVSSPQKNCLTIPSQCFRPHDSCSFPYAPLPMLLSTCFYCYLFKIGTHGKWNFFLKWWQMGYGDDRCCWVLKSFDKFFWQHQQFTDDDKKIKKKLPHCPISKLPPPHWQKSKRKKLSHCPISIKKILTKGNKKKVASLSHRHKKFLLTKTTRNKFLLTKDNHKKFPLCPITTLLSSCCMLIPLCSRSHAPVYMLPSLHV